MADHGNPLMLACGCDLLPAHARSSQALEPTTEVGANLR